MRRHNHDKKYAGVKEKARHGEEQKINGRYSHTTWLLSSWMTVMVLCFVRFSDVTVCMLSYF